MYQKISLLAMILMAGASNTFATTTITVGPSTSVRVENSRAKTVVTTVGSSATVHVESNGNSVTSSASSVKIDPKAGKNITIYHHGNVSASAIVTNDPKDKDWPKDVDPWDGDEGFPTVEDEDDGENFFDDDEFFKD